MGAFIEGIPSAAASPLAFAAYGICAIIFLLAGARLRQTSRLADEIKNMPEKDRRRALEIAADTKLPSKITAAEWLRLKRMRMAFLLAGSVVVAAFAVAVIALLSKPDTKEDAVMPKSWRQFVFEPVDDMLGFTIDYPADWHVIEDEMTGYMGAKPTPGAPPSQRGWELRWSLSGLNREGIIEHATGERPEPDLDSIYDTGAVVRFSRSIDDLVRDTDEPRPAVLSEKPVTVRIFADTTDTPSGERSDDAIIAESEVNGTREVTLYYAGNPGRSDAQDIWLFSLTCSAPVDSFAAYRPLCEEAIARARLAVPDAMGE